MQIISDLFQCLYKKVFHHMFTGFWKIRIHRFRVSQSTPPDLCEQYNQWFHVKFCSTRFVKIRTEIDTLYNSMGKQEQTKTRCEHIRKQNKRKSAATQPNPVQPLPSPPQPCPTLAQPFSSLLLFSSRRCYSLLFSPLLFLSSPLLFSSLFFSSLLFSSLLYYYLLFSSLLFSDLVYSTHHL